MKLLVSIIFGVLLISNVFCDIIDEFSEIFDLVPRNEIKDIFDKYMSEDEQFKEFIEFQRKEGPQLATTMIQNKEFMDIVKYIEANSDFFLPLPPMMGLYPRFKNPNQADNLENTGRSVNEFVEEVFAVLPKDEMSNLMKEKMGEKPEFKKFMDAINDPKYNELVDKFMNSPDLADTWALWKSKGLDAKDMQKLSLQLISWAY